MSLERAQAEDARILTLVKAIAALPGLHPVRWCGGHTDEALDDLQLASSTRYEGMTHPPSPADEYWIEVMCDPRDPAALPSLETLALACDETDEDDEETLVIMLSAPWEGLTITIAGRHDESDPNALARQVEIVRLEQTLSPPDPDKTSEFIRRRIDEYEQRQQLR